MDLLLGRALRLDVICVRGHGGPGDLRVGLVVVAAVDGEVVRAAVAVAPAASGLVAQGGVAGQVSDVVGDVVVGGQIGLVEVVGLAVDGHLGVDQHGFRGRWALGVTYWVSDHGVVGRRGSAWGRRGIGCQSSDVGSFHRRHCNGEENGGNECQEALLERHVVLVFLDL